MDPEYIAAIIEKQLQGEALSEEEQRVLDNLQIYLQKRLDVTGTELAYKAFRHSTKTMQEGPHRVYRLSWRPWAAAAALLLLAVSAWLLYPRGDHKMATESKLMAMDVQPGKQGAILTLGNGRQVVLDSMSNGVIARQSGADVTLDNGKLTYSGKQLAADIVYNTMTTPKGRKFQLVLPDGTKVWLNAASTLSFPTAFMGKERKVAVTGEAYFEVAKDVSKPFKVTVNNGATIDVLGTSFNVNAYVDEASLKTTLLEGSVRVIHLNDKVLLKPGQLAAIGGAAGIDVQTANIDKVMAWKNGLFDFDGASLTEVMNQLSRWYDIDVVYEKGVPPFEFGGKIGRDLTLANLLKFLEGAGVHFRIEEGRRLVVLP